MKKTAALLLLIGLVCAPAAYAQQTTPEVPAVPAPAAEPAPAPAELTPTVPAPEDPTAQAPAQDEFAPATSAPEVPAAHSPAESAHITPPPATSPAEQADMKKVKDGEDFVTLNFTNIDINALVKVMSELSRRNFLLDERVAGKVTIMTPKKISPEEAYQVFLSALEIKGFTAIEDGKITRIIPAAAAKQSALKVFQDGSDSRGEGYVTKLIRLNFVNPQEIVRTISALVTKNGSLIAYPATNSIIITDSVSNIRKMESLIHVMDVAASEGKGRINVYYLKNGNAEDMAKLIQALLSKLPMPPAGGTAPAGPSTIFEGAVSVSADKATNALIVIGSASDFYTIKDVIQKLDIRRRQVYVEAAVIEMSLAKQREFGFEFQAANLGNIENSNSMTTIGGTNYGNIGNVIAGGPAGLASMNGLNVGAVKGTFTFKGVEYLNVGALLHALQTDADVNVLSTPNILTTDNVKAEIMVGENVPFITGQTQNAATGAGAILNSIDRRDVGIKLQITPQITSDDSVRLDVKQEISDVIQTTGSAQSSLGPTTSKRSAETTVVIKDRQTMVIGGLIRDNLISSTSKVPILGDIPILGWFFKFKSTRMEKTNLMIFITPYIIKDGSDADALTKRKGELLEEFRKEYRIKRKTGQTIAPPAMPQRPASAGEKPSSEEVVSNPAPETTPAKGGAEAAVENHPAPAAQSPVSPAEGAR